MQYTIETVAPGKQQGDVPVGLIVRFLGAGLGQKRFVDVRDDATASDSGLDQRVQLLVATDGELQMTRCDALHFQVLGRVAGQLEDFGGEVLQDGSAVHGRGGADTTLGNYGVFQESVNTADWELRSVEPRNNCVSMEPGTC